MNYALITNGVVVNIIWLLESNASDFPSAVKIEDRPVAVGDTYDGIDFYRNGVKVLTPQEQIVLELQDALAALETLGYTDGGEG